MSLNDRIRWKALERRTATAYFAAGVTFLVSIVLTVQEVLPLLNTAGALLVVGGLLATFAGLFGTYPWVKDAAPRLARIGLATTVVASSAITALFVVVVGSNLLFGTPIQGAGSPSAAPVLFMVTLVSAGVSFLLYGIAALRTGVPSRAIGALMLTPALAWPGYMAAHHLVGEQISYLPLVVFAIVSVVFLTIGHRLSSTPSVDTAESPSDSAA